MISKSEARGILGDAWRDSGLEGRSGRWRLAGAEVHWVVQIEGDWLGRMSIVADAALLSTERGPTSPGFPLRIFVESLPNLADVSLVEALALDSNMADEARRDILRDAASEVARFVVAHDTLESLRSAYLRGDLDSMSIRKDLRQTLEMT